MVKRPQKQQKLSVREQWRGYMAHHPELVSHFALEPPSIQAVFILLRTVNGLQYYAALSVCTEKLKRNSRTLNGLTPSSK